MKCGCPASSATDRSFPWAASGPSSWSPRSPTAAEEQAAPAKMLPPPDYAAERAKLIGQLPAAPAGAVTLDASELRPLVQGDADFNSNATVRLRE